MLLISPTEPKRIQALGTTSSKPEKYGVDVLWFARRLKYGIQRKRFHEDFIASLHDGRLQREVAQMQALDAAFLIVEGFGTWTMRDQLLENPFSKTAMFSLFATFAIEFGVTPIRVKDMQECILAIEAIHSWTEKEGHTSLLNRPGPKKNQWGQRTSKTWGMHLLQSFPGIGPKQADRIWEHFGGIPMRWDVEGPKDLMVVEGIGKVRAQAMWKALT